MPDPRRKTAVLISGRGSNLAALIAAAVVPHYPAEIRLVIADNAEARGIPLAREHMIATTIVDRERFETRAAFEATLDTELRDAGVELICLAGFMRILSKGFVAAWHNRILNIHPSLLPLFPGLDTHARALAAGIRIHGATVHFVRPQMDSGPIVAQGAVPVLPADDPETLAARVLAVEHRIYPLALKLVASGRAHVVGERVEVDGEKPAGDAAALLSPPEL